MPDLQTGSPTYLNGTVDMFKMGHMFCYAGTGAEIRRPPRISWPSTAMIANSIATAVLL